MKLLAIDDQRDNLITLRAVLGEVLPGCQLLTAQTGAAGIELARREDPDAILLDIVMPGMDGYEVCRRLKDDPALRDIPVIFLTALRTDREGRVRALEAGAEGFLSKPPEPHELVAMIRSMAKVKAASRLRRLETEELEALVTERTAELELQLRERAQVEAELRRLSTRQEALLSAVPDIIMEVNAAKVYRWANPAGLAFFGPGVLGQEAASYFEGDQDTYVRVKPLFNGDADVFYVESWQRRQDGEKRLLAWWCKGLRDAQGRTVGALSTARDITEARRVEEALRESEARYRLIADNMADCVTIQDLSLRPTYVSPSIQRIRGFTVEEALAQRMDEIMTPTSLEIAGRVLAEELAREASGADPGRARVLEVEEYRKDGTTVWVEVTVSFIRDPTGQAVGILSLSRDISDRRRAETALQTERDKLHAFVDAAPVALFVLDEHEAVVQCNPAAERLFGRSRTGPAPRCGDLVGCVHRRDDPRGCGKGPRCPVCPLYGAVREALAGRAVREREADLEVDGSPERRWLVANAEPLALEGRPGAVLAVVDVTELRRAQQEREALQANLAQSDRLASMGMLAAGVAHEINNPLSYVLYNLESLAEDLPGLVDRMRRVRQELVRIQGAAEVAHLLGGVDEPAFDDVVDRLRDAVDGARRIKQITRGLGTFARVERTEVAPVNVQDCLDHAITLAQNEIKYRARLVKDYQPVPAVIASDGKLAQVVLNLLINAAHAIGEGHVEDHEIRVRTRVEQEQVVIEVSDTGPGIAPEHQGRLFEPFFTTKGVGVGSGLGLSICKRIVTEFGGKIHFETELGHGTTFRIELPPMPADWGSRAPEAADARAEAPAIRGRILVVDDEAGIRQILVRLLGRDHEVVTVASGEEAEARLAEDTAFDLILCDLMMPRMSGMEFHARLAARSLALAEKVVFITGGAFTPGAGDYLARVGNLRIEKPFDMPSVKRLVAELLRAGRDRSR